STSTLFPYTTLFRSCSELLFSVDFDNCLLNLSSFYKRNLKKTKFTNCSLHEVDFTEANLALAVFENCDLAGAVFEHTNLEKADRSEEHTSELQSREN